MNVPNKLTLARIYMAPAVIILILLAGFAMPDWLAYILAAAVFGLISLSDMFDGRIARKRNLITDFGKFLDPLADKVLVLGTMLAILYRHRAIGSYFFWGVLVVIVREFTVTAMRLVVSGRDGTVIAASKLGKIKTVLQMNCVLVALTEPALQALVEHLLGEKEYVLHDIFPLTILSTVAMTVLTIWSGADYLVRYKKYFMTDI